MNIEKHCLERRLSVIVAVTLLLADFAIFCILVIVQSYPIEQRDWFLTLCVGASVLLLHLLLFPREKATLPLLCSILSFLLCLGTILFIVGCSCSSLKYEIENPHYEAELAEWEKNKTTVDPTPDTPYTMADAAYNHLNGRPHETLTVEPDSIDLLTTLLVVSICLAVIVSFIYLIYSYICIRRYLSAVTQRRREQKIIHSHENAYAEIAKFHSYKEAGAMSDKEFEDIRQQILSNLKRP